MRGTCVSASLTPTPPQLIGISDTMVLLEMGGLFCPIKKFGQIYI